ncbi:hypothetical protein IE980_21970 [Klebsiella pneumoniae]|uniref:Uncharacterized protein n=1 Tax=Klebsiella pneumoniae TaxID=573 RepID=A0A927HXS4_KLEPN|nr:hypothetical protein [Klebsiella pneumoniae]
MGAILAPPQPFSILFKTMFHFYDDDYKKRKKRRSLPARAGAGKGFEKMKIQPIVCRGAEAKPAAR